MGDYDLNLALTGGFSCHKFLIEGKNTKYQFFHPWLLQYFFCFSNSHTSKAEVIYSLGAENLLQSGFTSLNYHLGLSLSYFSHGNTDKQIGLFFITRPDVARNIDNLFRYLQLFYD